MRRLELFRGDLTGLLTRPPCGAEFERGWASLLVDPVEQVKELADLCHRGLLTREEFERQKAKVLER